MARKSVASLVSEIETIAAIQLRLGRQQKPLDPPEDDVFWSPSLGLAQQEIFDSTARFLLAHGERFSGKTVGILHKLVRHAWTNHAAHVLIIVGVRRQATAGGAWTKLIRDILPEWKTNLEGFDFDEPRMTTEKDVVLEMTNRHGTKSLFHLISIPHGGKLADRIKGVEATAVFVDELVGIGGEEYFRALIQQIGRRVDVPISEQFYAAATNPGGPSHWVYKLFIGGGTNDDGTPFLGGRIKPDGSFDEKFFVVHVPINQNPDARAQEYYRDFVLPAVANDPVEYQRMVEGKWIDRPSGDAIFGGYFVPEFHIRGDIKEGTILRPSTARGVITLGYDLGDVNSCICILQDRFTKDKTIWLGLDELVFTDKPVPYSKLVPLLLDKMNWWCDLEQFAFRFDHISDRSAFDRFRATSGGSDQQIVERLSLEFLRKAPDRWPWLKTPIKMKECPKPPGSVAARIKITREHLSSESLFFSGPKMPRHIDAMKFLESKKDEPMVPMRSPHLHPYDAMSYALYYNSLGGSVVTSATPQTPVTPQVTSFGD
jgi:hypothetical protein